MTFPPTKDKFLRVNKRCTGLHAEDPRSLPKKTAIIDAKLT